MLLHVLKYASIGSLGKDHSIGIVTKVVVDNAFIRGTTNGLRIKTWQVYIYSLFSLKKSYFTCIFLKEEYITVKDVTCCRVDRVMFNRYVTKMLEWKTFPIR